MTASKNRHSIRISLFYAKADTALQLHPLLRLTSLLDGNSSVRVYFRASGGLARLAGAAFAAAAATAACFPHDAGTGEEKRASTNPSRACRASTIDGDDGGTRDKQSGVGAVGSEEELMHFASMLAAVSAAVKGRERLAAHEVWKSGLLGRPCAQAMRIAFDGDKGGAGAVAAAGAAALLVSRVVDDLSVRTHVAR